MYLQIKHKTQSKDPWLDLDPNQSCRSGIKFYSTHLHNLGIYSCLPSISKAWRILNCFLSSSCAFSDRNSTLYKQLLLSSKESASSIILQHLSRLQATLSSINFFQLYFCGQSIQWIRIMIWRQDYLKAEA